MKKEKSTTASNSTSSDRQQEDALHLPPEDGRRVIVLSSGENERSNSNLKGVDALEYAEFEQLGREFTLKVCTRYYRGDHEFSDAKMQRYLALIKRIRLGWDE